MSSAKWLCVRPALVILLERNFKPSNPLYAASENRDATGQDMEHTRSKKAHRQKACGLQSRKSRRWRTIFTCLVATPLLAIASKADAQNYIDYNHPSIIVDLSVLGDGGYDGQGGLYPKQSVNAPSVGSSMVPGGLAPSSGRKLLVPGARYPTSTLHIAPLGGASMPKAPAPQKKKQKKVVKMETEMAPSAPTKSVPPPPAPTTPPKAAEAPQKPVVATSTQAAPEPTPKKAAEPTTLTKTTAAPPPPTVKKAPEVAKAPPVPKAPTIEPANDQVQQAALPKDGSLPADGKALRILFAEDATKLPAASKEGLKALADKVKEQPDMRLQLMAYAGSDKLSSSLARRQSLSRALSVRSFLIANGVRSTRIDVRALGNKTTEKPLNRVDLNIISR